MKTKDKRKDITVEESIAAYSVAMNTFMESQDANDFYGGVARLKAPDNVVKNTDSISDFLIEMGEGQDMKNVPYRSSIKTTHIALRASLMMSEDIRTSRQLSAYDREVLDAVITWYYYGGRYFTPAQLFRVIYGVDSAKCPQTGEADDAEWEHSKFKIHVSKTAIEDINASLAKMMRSTLEMELMPEMTEEGAASRVVSGALLPLTCIRVDLAQGGQTYVYRVDSAPNIYAFGMKAKSLVSVPIQFSKFPKDISRTRANLAARNVLYQSCVVALADGVSQSVYIPYSKIYEQRGAVKAVQKERAKDCVCAFLVDWVSSGVVASFDELIDNGVPTGVVICLASSRFISLTRKRADG